MAKIPIPGTNKILGDGEIFFIAEIGKNFIQTEDERSVEEYLENAKALVKAAKEAGADAVKFQTHEVEDEVLNLDFISPHFQAKDRYSWVKRNMEATPLETFWKPLKKYCDSLGILFFSTPMSRKAARKLSQIGVPMWKVGSGDVQDYVMLNDIASTGKPAIISSGMTSLAEFDDVIAYLDEKKVPLGIMYCVSKYPAPKESFNVATIELFREKYPNAVVGFSDHSLTHDVVLAAMKVGAQMIEKHFSFSRDLWGSDHKVSLTPEGFAEMVNAARTRAYEAIDPTEFYGTKDTELEGALNEHRPFFNKALVAGTDIPAGTTFAEEMIFAMRPIKLAGGLPSNRLADVVGKKAKRTFAKFDPITEDDIS